MEFATSIFNTLSGVLGNPYIVSEVLFAEYIKLSPIEQNGQLRLYRLGQFIDCVLLHPTKSDMIVRMFRMSKSKMPEAKMAFRRLSTHMPCFYNNFMDWYTPNRLTSLSDIMRQFDSWSSAHIAVQAGLSEAITREQVGHIINNQFCDKARSPMHLACDLNRLDLLEKCVMVGGDLRLQDENGDTVLHYVITKNNKEFIKFVCRNLPKEKLDTQNLFGETALHIACKNNKFENCKILVESGASVNICSKIGYPIHYTLKHANHQFTEYILSKDPSQVTSVCKKYCSLPIFWSRTGEDVATLLKHGSKVVDTSTTSDTPLHVMVLKDRLDAAIGLIFSHADINVKGKNGNTPLHLAVINDNKWLVKMLLLFGADCVSKNDFNETPGLLALRSTKPNKEEIVELLSSVGGIHLDTPDGVKIPNSTISSKTEQTPRVRNGLGTKKSKILCLDGGGIRGLVLTQILIALEDETGKKASELFDWIGGTSTGGILALSLSLGLKAVDCQSIYFRLKDKVFTGARPYASAPMESFLKSVFGESTTMAELKSEPKIVITSVLANQRPAKLHLFRNYEAIHKFSSTDAQNKKLLQKRADSVTIDDIIKCPLDTPLWQVARSSGAAPTYFRSIENFVDGGLMSNNPTLDMLTEIHQYNKALRKFNREDEMRPPGLVVSLGTGKSPVVKVKSVDIAISTNPIDLLNTAFAGVELTQIMIDAACECDGHIHNRADAWCDSISVPYFRLNPQLKDDIAMNETNDEALVDMLWTTKLYLQKNKHLIQEIAHLLLNDA